MQSPSTNSRGTRLPHPDRNSPRAHPQASVSPTFPQSAAPPTFPTPFPTPQYGYNSRSAPATPPTSLSPPNWQRPRATSSYALESATIAFPEPQIHRGTSTRGISRPPSLPPRPDSETVPAQSHRGSVTSSKIQGSQVALRIDLERCRLRVSPSST